MFPVGEGSNVGVLAVACVCFWEFACTPSIDSRLNQIKSFLVLIIILMNFDILVPQHNCLASKCMHCAALS